MSKPIPFDEQIVATLTTDCTSVQAAEVLDEAQKVLADLTKQADAADVASLSPLASSAEARKLRQTANDYRFEADRMEASVSALTSRLADLKDAEAANRRQADADAVRAIRDKLAADIAKDYPGIVQALATLTKRIIESDRECARVGIRETAEAIGRGIPASFYANMAPIHRIQDRAPGMVTGNRLAWEETMAVWTFFALEGESI